MSIIKNLAKKKTNVFLTTLFIIFFVSILLCCFSSVFVKANEIEYSDVNIEKSYSYNFKFETPDATVKINSEEVGLEAYLVYPSGEISYDRINYLYEIGTYSVVYHVSYESKVYTQVKQFEVIDSLYDVEGNGYAVYKERCERLNGISGLEVNLFNGDVFHYNKPINIRDMTQYNTLCSVVSMTEAGIFSFGSLYFKLEDILDPDNYVLLKFNKDPYPSFKSGNYTVYSAWVKAGASNQPIGFENGKVSGESYHYGINVNFAMAGVTKSDYDDNIAKIPLEQGSANFVFDYKNKIVYAEDTVDYILKKIVDLDDDNTFEDLWSGFKSDKARLSLYVSEIASSSATIFIKDLYGADLFENVYGNDGFGPDILFDSEPSDVGAVGYKYKFNDVLLSDDNGISGNIVKMVFRDYYSSARVSVISDNEGFIPTEEGVYYVEYSAKDTFGNIGRKVVEVNAVEFVPDIVISNGISEEYPDGVPLGKEVDTTPEVSGCIGEYSVKSYAKKKSDSALYEITDDTFIPETSGEYEIIYRVFDEIGRKIEKRINFSTTSNTDIEFYDSVENDLPHNFIVGYEYKLPALYGYDYSDGTKTTVNTKIKVNGSFLSSEKFKPTAAGNISIKYYLEDETTLVQSYEKTAYNINGSNGIDIQKLFIIEGGATAGIKNKYLNIKFDDSASATYINPLPSKTFNFTFKMSSESDNFDKLNLSFTDPVTGDKFVIQFTVGADKVLYYAILGSNSKPSYFKHSVLENGIERDENYKYNELNIILSYNNDTKTLSINNTKLVIRKQPDNSLFKGFVSDKVSFSMEYEKSSAESDVSVSVISVCDHVMQNIGGDYTAPLIMLIGDSGGCYSIGQVVSLPRAIAIDMISPVISYFKLSVKTFDGKFVKDVNGLELNKVDAKWYSFVMSQKGNYLLSYEAEDSSGNLKTITVMYYCVDEIVPKISLSDGYATIAKAGESVLLAKATATVDGVGDIAYSVYLKDHNGDTRRITLNDENSIVLDVAGVYTVYYYATSAAGRTAFVSYRIVCS